MEVAVSLYIIIGLVLAGIGVGVWTDEHRECDKIGARMFFLAPVWPLAVVLYIGYFLCTQTRNMWLDTGWSKK